MQKKAMKWVALGLAALVGLSACDGGTTGRDAAGEQSAETSAEPEAQDAESTPAAAIVRSGNLRLGMVSLPSTLDPQMAADNQSWDVLAATNEGLYRIDASGNPELALAESVYRSADGLTYRFVLRSAQWSDGSAITAKDFVTAWQRLLTPEKASEVAYLGVSAGLHRADSILSGAKKPTDLNVTASEDGTILTVMLSRPVPQIESLLCLPAFAPVPTDFISSLEQTGGVYGQDAASTLSSGPYVATEFVPLDSAVLVANPNYYRTDEVNLESIDVVATTDPQASLAAGDIDLIGGQAYSQTDTVLGTDEGIVFMNLRDDALANLNLRKALANAVDREALIEQNFEGNALPVSSLISSNMALRFSAKEFNGAELAEDTQVAKNNFDTAKTELKQDSIALTLLCDDSARAMATAEALKQQWETALPGVEITINTVNREDFFSQLMGHNFSLAITEWSAPYNDPLAYMERMMGNAQWNHGYWSNAEYDEKIAAVMVGYPQDVKGEDGKTSRLPISSWGEERWKLMEEAEATLIADVPMIPLYQIGGSVEGAAKVQDVIAYPWGYGLDLTSARVTS